MLETSIVFTLLSNGVTSRQGKAIPRAKEALVPSVAPSRQRKHNAVVLTNNPAR
ncbi:hypothetical protein [Gemmatimonas sp.]|uniref:hypothetical protein n=1 Tax=Gemmatimonas sp. TaxID=1962908 RepID=UPI0039839861